jgi:hypothetical protein
MALQSSGPISIQDIATEFEDAAPHSLSEFYGAASGVPTSGAIKVAQDFYGKANAAYFQGTGGTVNTYNGYTYHVFTASSTFTVTNAGNAVGNAEFDVMVVAGGGGGGSGGLSRGGGGAGGLLHSTGLTASVQGYTITVGAGGATGSNGSNSSAFGITSTGGGRGGSQYGAGPTSGGSGGGSAYNQGSGGAGISGQGNNGGYAAGGRYAKSGGGGGATEVGQSTSGDFNQARDGGDGANKSSYYGTSVGESGWFAGGGSGYHGETGMGTGGLGGGGNRAQSGQANTGGGGGGAAGGGSGIVIVRYLTPA